MFLFMLFSTLFPSIFTDLEKQHWICNSSDLSVWYTYCDKMKHSISIKLEPCLTLKGGRGYLQLSYIPRRDIKKLYFNIYMYLKTIEFPMRTEVVCRGFDDQYSFCRAVKGETVNTTIPFSFNEIHFSKGQYRIVTEAIAGSPEEMLFCLNFTAIHTSKLK
ncbi:PREDICTED: lymphocyte antigen 96 [Chrysochloris asiatica]|uniref:Lymphocyte antigen 96 n=1 Tax=Chrysochloris asiatica TaxID=185453 RepID=A0A9B0WLP1_CHRAS|nr:PREDICTED: lymphocyte antigen 96 [Chrysochloris asiatica]